MSIEKLATSPISAITSKTCSPSRWTGVGTVSCAIAPAVGGATAIAGSLLHERHEAAARIPLPARPEPGQCRLCRPLPTPARLILDVLPKIDKADRPPSRMALARPDAANPSCLSGSRQEIALFTLFVESASRPTPFDSANRRAQTRPEHREGRN